MFLKFARDFKKIYGGDDLSMKAAGAEIQVRIDQEKLFLLFKITNDGNRLPTHL